MSVTDKQRTIYFAELATITGARAIKVCIPIRRTALPGRKEVNSTYSLESSGLRVLTSDNGD